MLKLFVQVTRGENFMSDKTDQIFDLLEKVYTELQETKTTLQETRTELHDTKTMLRNDIKKIEITLEHEIKPDIKTLYELQVNINNKLEDHDRRFDTLEIKMDRHGQEIGAMKRKNAHGI